MLSKELQEHLEKLSVEASVEHLDENVKRMVGSLAIILRGSDK